MRRFEGQWLFLVQNVQKLLMEGWSDTSGKIRIRFACAYADWKSNRHSRGRIRNGEISALGSVYWREATVGVDQSQLLGLHLFRHLERHSGLICIFGRN